MYEIATSLHHFLSGCRTFYMNLTPNTPDFTANKGFTLSLHLPLKRLDLAVTPVNILEVCAAIQQFAFKKSNIVFCWNIKDFFTYSKFYTKTAVPCEASLIDLSLIESFNGVLKNAPESYMEALDRAKEANQNPSWKKVYNKLFLPLSKEIIPSIETTPLLNISTGKLVYSHYQINGQTYGRSRCESAYLQSYNPHVLSSELKAILHPRGYGRLFLYCDYKHMEVSVLQWLSKDPVLKTMLASGKDIYQMLHILLFGTKCKTKEDRQKCKLIFLPVIFGQSASSLAYEFKIQEDEAKFIIARLRKVFHVAFEWLDNTTGEDYFGRRRDFTNAPHKSRNFSIQAPAAMFCLEKLIALWQALVEHEAELAYHVHDGYGIICTKKNYKEVFSIALRTLESYSEIMPELSIGITGHIGIGLNKMVTIESKRNESV